MSSVSSVSSVWVSIGARGFLALATVATLLVAVGTSQAQDDRATRLRLARTYLENSDLATAAEDLTQRITGPLLARQEAFASDVVANQGDLSHDQKRALFQRLSDAERFGDRLNAEVRERLSLVSKVENTIVERLADEFTAAELRELNDWNRSALGRKINRFFPGLLEELNTVVSDTMSPELMVEILDSVVAAERAALGFPPKPS